MLSVFSDYFPYVLNFFGVVDLVISRDDESRLMMPSYRLVIDCDNDFGFPWLLIIRCDVL